MGGQAPVVLIPCLKVCCEVIECVLLAEVILPYAASQRSLIMADKSNKTEGNVRGMFYVDVTCIDCGLCRETAHSNFKTNGDGDRSIVFKQPENDAEHHACSDAKGACPVEAIGDDGA